MKQNKLILLFFLFLAFSCSTFDLDTHKDSVIDSKGRNLHALINGYSIKKLHCKEENELYLYAYLYIKNFGFDSNAKSLLERATKTNNLFYNEAIEKMLESLILQGKTINAYNYLNSIYHNYQGNKKDFYQELITQSKKINLDSIKNNKNYYNLIIYYFLKNKSSYKESREELYTYLHSLLQESKFSIKEKELALKLASHYNDKLIAIFAKHIDGKTLTQAQITEAMESFQYQSEFDLIKTILGKTNLHYFQNALESTKDLTAQHAYNWVITFRPIRGNDFVKSKVFELLDIYKEENEEYYQLKAFYFYMQKNYDNVYAKELVHYYAINHGKYYAYSILADFLRFVLKEKNASYFEEALMPILHVESINTSRHSVILHLLHLLYPSNEILISTITNEIPFSLVGLKLQSLDTILLKNKPHFKHTHNADAKKWIQKYELYEEWKLLELMNDDEIKSLKDPNLRRMLFEKKHQILINNEDYYNGLKIAHEITATDYPSHFSSIDYETLKLLYPLHYFDEVMKNSRKYEIDPALTYAIMREESHYKKDIRSPVNAIGLMQIMPSTATWLSSDVGIPTSQIDLIDPDQNIRFGCYYLRYIMNRVKDLNLIMAGYNSGHNRAIRWDKSFSLPNRHEEYETKIPFEETRHYLRKVNQSYEAYKYILQKEALPLMN